MTMILSLPGCIRFGTHDARRLAPAFAGTSRGLKIHPPRLRLPAEGFAQRQDATDRLTAGRWDDCHLKDFQLFCSIQQKALLCYSWVLSYRFLRLSVARQPNLTFRQHLFYFYTSIKTLPNEIIVKINALVVFTNLKACFTLFE